MSIIQQRFSRSPLGPASIAFAAAVVITSAPRISANTKPTEVPAKVIAHLPLKDAPGNEMLLQNKGDKQYLYVQKASKQGFTVIDVTKTGFLPSLVNHGAQSSDATAGNLKSWVPTSVWPKFRTKIPRESFEIPTARLETVKILDLSESGAPQSTSDIYRRNQHPSRFQPRADLFDQQRRSLDPQSRPARPHPREEKACLWFRGRYRFHAAGLRISFPMGVIAGSDSRE